MRGSDHAKHAGSDSDPTQNTLFLSSVLADVKRIQADMLSILNRTTWPPAVTTHVQAFIDSLNVGFGRKEIAGDETLPRKETEDVLRTLRGVHEQLEAKSDTFKSSEGCTLHSIERKFAFQFPKSTIKFLEGSRTRTENSLTVINNLICGASKAAVAPAAEVNPVAQPSMEPPSPASAPAPPAVTTPSTSGPQHWSWLRMTKAVFNTADVASGAIPVIGGYIGAVAKAGTIVVEMIETMKDNDETAKQLAERVRRLSEMLERVRQTAGEPRGDRILSEINDLQAELDGIKQEVEGLESDGKAAKFMSGRKNAQALKDFQEKVRIALEETQAKATLTTSIITAEIYNDSLLDRLGDGNYGARANLAESATCLGGTRVAILARIDAWIGDMGTENRIFWITGSAGRGKSTVASTVAMKWKQRTPCALFHFRRDQSTLDTMLVCSLAKQLAKSGDRQLLDAILANMRSNKDIAQQLLEVQFTTLLASPLAKCRTKPVLIIVDALDECSSPRYAQDFITLVKRNASSLPPNIKFLLTSRPDYPMLPYLRDPNNQVHDLNLEPMEDVLGDIGRYLRHGFAEIRRQHGIQEDWPADNTIPELAKMSEGLFQWAQTILSYVKERAPTTRLAEILDPAEKWEGLDSTYEQVLSKAIKGLRRSAPKRELLSRVLETILAVERPVSLEVIAFLQDGSPALKGMDPATASNFLRDEILADLNSLLLIPSTNTDSLLLTHTSIHDFLLDRDRCEEQSLAYSVDIQRSHGRLAMSCLERMNRLLKQNMCDVADVSQPFSDINSTALTMIPAGLRYCCQTWTFHLTGTGHSLTSDPEMANGLATELAEYSTKKALFWLEVMGALGRLSQAVQVAKEASLWISEFNSITERNSLSILWDDVQRFASAFAEPISVNPLEIYRSALGLCPIDTELWKHFEPLALIRTVRGLQGPKWSADVWIKRVEGGVRTVAMSPNGKLLASGSNDGMIRLWDLHTGAQVGEPLSGHADWVSTGCFSPEGKLLASGSGDKTVRLWNTQTGVQVGEPLSGHTDWVRSVCFSPDGKLLASASNDRTIRLWNAQTGAQVGEPLGGHTDCVSTVCFSPDGKQLASGSDDRTIRLWDAHTGARAGETLSGHVGWVSSVAFSPDSKLLASGSNDGTIRLWDAHTGAQAGEPLSGHAGWVSSVTFSPDGKLLASGSGDRTIRLWDVHTGAQAGEPLSGHVGWVISVSFSSDGKLLASASNDGTVRLWDTHTLAQDRGSLAGHTGWVRTVCFSPDGKLLASASNDRTIRLWNAQTGAQVGEPLSGHTDCVSTVCFSPNGKLLASGSGDSTIRLWHVCTGARVGEPLSGHGGWVSRVCFSPDGELLASGSDDKTVRLWDVHTGTQVGEPLSGHTGWMKSVCFSPDGKLVVAISSQTPTAWNITTRELTTVPSNIHDQSDIYVRINRPWVSLASRNLLWLPPVYWLKQSSSTGSSSRGTISRGTLVLSIGRHIFIFDVSRLFPPFDGSINHDTPHL